MQSEWLLVVSRGNKLNIFQDRMKENKGRLMVVICFTFHKNTSGNLLYHRGFILGVNTKQYSGPVITLDIDRLSVNYVHSC